MLLAFWFVLKKTRAASFGTAELDLVWVQITPKIGCLWPLDPCRSGHQPDRDGDGGYRLRAEALLRGLPASPQGGGVQLQVLVHDEADSGSGEQFDSLELQRRLLLSNGGRMFSSWACRLCRHRLVSTGVAMLELVSNGLADW